MIFNIETKRHFAIVIEIRPSFGEKKNWAKNTVSASLTVNIPLCFEHRWCSMIMIVR